MNISKPPKPFGDGPAWTFMEKVWERLWGGSLDFHNSSTVTWIKSSRGLTAHASNGGLGGSNGILCVVTKLFSAGGKPCDYVGVTKWNVSDGALSGTEFLCAKSLPSRGPLSETIDGVLINYQNYTDNQRLAVPASPLVQEWHACHTRYIPWAC